MTEWRYFKFKKKENIGNLNTFQEKFIILCNNGYKVCKIEKLKIQNRSLENNFFSKKLKF